jgi:hypothetical protein
VLEKEFEEFEKKMVLKNFSLYRSTIERVSAPNGEVALSGFFFDI